MNDLRLLYYMRGRDSERGAAQTWTSVKARKGESIHCC